MSLARELDPAAKGFKAAAQFVADQKLASLTAARKKSTEKRPIQANTTWPTAKVVNAPQPVLSVQQQRELEDLYRRGMSAMDSGQRDQAVHYWELVWSMDPDYQNVTEYLSQDYLTRGMEFFVAGDLAESVSNWESAVRVNPADPKAVGYLQRAREQADRMQKIKN